MHSTFGKSPRPRAAGHVPCELNTSLSHITRAKNVSAHGRRNKGWRMSCDVFEATEGLENELCRMRSNRRVEEWAVSYAKQQKGWRMSYGCWFSSSKETAPYTMCCEGDVHCGVWHDGVIQHHAVPPRQTVNTAYNCTFLQHHLHPALRRKWHLVI